MLLGASLINARILYPQGTFVQIYSGIREYKTLPCRRAVTPYGIIQADKLSSRNTSYSLSFFLLGRSDEHLYAGDQHT
jgi:hypothetical protein